MNRKFNFLQIYNLLIKGSLSVVFDISVAL